MHTGFAAGQSVLFVHPHCPDRVSQKPDAHSLFWLQPHMPPLTQLFVSPEGGQSVFV
jgi:hypothetical protein